MAEAEAKTEEKPALKGAAGGGSKLVPVLLLVNTVLLAGVLVMVFLKLPARHAGGEKAAAGEHVAADPHAKPDAPKPGPPGPMLRLPDFVVHLRDTDSERYARMSFEMELPDEKAKEAVTARMPQIRDAFLSYLSDRNAEELRGSDAIGRVKGTLARKLSEIVPDVAVRNLYVTDLIVQ